MKSRPYLCPVEPCPRVTPGCESQTLRSLPGTRENIQCASRLCSGYSDLEMESRTIALLLLLQAAAKSQDVLTSVTMSQSQQLQDAAVQSQPVHTSKYDPQVELPTPGLIRLHGYPAESHIVQTADGFLLTIHRIPHGRGIQADKGPILLQHGLLGSSADWVIIGPLKALAYLLADAGYDVWMGNARGNTYSRYHVSLSSKDSEFWDFSFQEMGQLDLPAVIDHILKVTGYEKLTYVGHSMGTTMFYTMAATMPEYGDKVDAMFSLAPVAFLRHAKSPIRLLAPFAKNLMFIAKFLGADEFLPQNKILRFLSKYGCELYATQQKICENWIFVLIGFDPEQFNVTLLPRILSHTPAGTSTRTLVHFAQLINSGNFQMYDFGEKENKRRYNTETPPQLDLGNITVPISLHYSDNDWLAGPRDVKALYAQLRSKIAIVKVPLEAFNHVDFLWGKDVRRLVYDELIDLIHHVKKVQRGGIKKINF